MNESQLRSLYPRASASFIRANADPQPRDSGTATKLERSHATPPHAASPVIEENSKRYLVRYLSVRRRLLDTDNLVSKAHTDALRYFKIIPDDNPEMCSLETTQRKCAKGEQEHTLVEIYEIKL